MECVTTVTRLSVTRYKPRYLQTCSGRMLTRYPAALCTGRGESATLALAESAKAYECRVLLCTPISVGGCHTFYEI